MFHVAEPSNWVLHQTISILEKTIGWSCLKGNHCDLNEIQNGTIPMIMINGNHDKPNQIIQNQIEEDTSCLDLLEKFGVSRFIGKELDRGIMKI